MNFFSYLLRAGRGRVLIIAGAGLVNGFIGTAFLAIVNYALHGSRLPRHYLVLLFVVLASARLVAYGVSQLLLVRFSQEKLLELCDTLCRNALRTPFRVLEEIGPASILTTLSDDVAILGAAIQVLPTLAANVAILVGCAIYVAFSSWVASLTMVGLAVLGALCHKLLLKRAYKAIQAARSGRDTLYQHFRSLTEGMKELKMSTARQAIFLDQEVGQTTRELRENNLVAARDYLMAQSWSHGMFYLMIGLLLFALPSLEHLSTEKLTIFIFVALYAMTPVWSLTESLPTLHRGRVALERIDALGMSLTAAQSKSGSAPRPASEEALDRNAASAPRIELDEVTFAYPSTNGDQDGFVLGPLSLSLEPGKLVFIVGGNGSGKTTLVKLLTGLYSPNCGEIRVNGLKVGIDSQSYRHLFSAVYFDFHVFDRLLGCEGPDLSAKADAYLRLLHLEKKVRIENGRFSTTALSQGQRRRLALLSAYLEDRPVYVFDEWAADQDPNYKEVFYGHLLPQLKSRGKTAIVITHDDRYFGLGDVIVKLDYGRVVDYAPSSGPAPQLAQSSAAVNRT